MVFYGVYWSIDQAVISKKTNLAVNIFCNVINVTIEQVPILNPGTPDITSHDDDTEPSITTCWVRFVKNDLIQFSKWSLIP